MVETNQKISVPTTKSVYVFNESEEEDDDLISSQFVTDCHPGYSLDMETPSIQLTEYCDDNDGLLDDSESEL